MNREQQLEFIDQETKNTPSNIRSVGFGRKIKDGKLLLDSNAIIYLVNEKKPIDQIPINERIPSTKVVNNETFVTDVIESINTKSTCALWLNWYNTPPANQNSFRPLKGGVSVTNYTQLSCCAGTLGFIAVDNDDGTLVGISNNHVLMNDAFYTSERDNSAGQVFENWYESVATQPNELGNKSLSNRIGLVKKYIPFHVPGNGINTVDVAAISIDPVAITSGLISTSESWKQEGFVELTSAPPFATTSEINALLADGNTYYYSSGRTTGMKGNVLYHRLYCIGSDMSIPIGDYTLQGADKLAYIDKSFVLVATYQSDPTSTTVDVCSYPSYKGDSGSAVLADVNGTFKIVGILYGGGTYNGIPTYAFICRIDEVASQLNISAWDGSTPNYASQTQSTKIVSGKSSAPYITVGSDRYWQAGLINNATNPPNFP